LPSRGERCPFLGPVIGADVLGKECGGLVWVVVVDLVGREVVIASVVVGVEPSVVRITGFLVTLEPLPNRLANLLLILTVGDRVVNPGTWTDDLEPDFLNPPNLAFLGATFLSVVVDLVVVDLVVSPIVVEEVSTGFRNLPNPAFLGAACVSVDVDLVVDPIV